jgi:predicted transcriptional regulator
MSPNEQRHTLTLDPDVVRRIDRLRKSQSLSSFVNHAVVAYSAEVERRMFESTPVSADESS